MIILTMEENNSSQYEEEPVFYCEHCLSLHVMVTKYGTEYCAECGSTDIVNSDLETWKHKYMLKYGKALIKDKPIWKSTYVDNTKRGK